MTRALRNKHNVLSLTFVLMYFVVLGYVVFH
jgi:hypothetical protein